MTTLRPRLMATYAHRFPTLARRRMQRTQTQQALSGTYIGTDPDGGPVALDESARSRHMHVIGTTGSGKTTLLKRMVLADALQGHGAIVVDPWGSHQGSLFYEILEALLEAGLVAAGRVHVIDFNVRTHCVPLNFLARFDDTDISVLAAALLQAIERVWNEDTHDKPTTRSILKASLMACAERGLPMTSVKELFDPLDRNGFRAETVTRLNNEYARDEIERLHLLSLDTRNARDFRAEVIGPLNRINEFLSTDAIRATLGVVDKPHEPRRTLDLLEIMNKGDVLLVNLQHGPFASEADCTLFGALLLRYLFLLASRRTHYTPYYCYIDECHRFLTGDIANILAEIRKFGVGMVLAHQFLSQLGKPDDLIYQALINCTEIKTVFRVKDPLEAQRLAEMVLPLNTERPLATSVRPTVIGHRRVKLASRSKTHSASETDSEGWGESETISHSTSWSSSTARGTTRGKTYGTGTSSGSARSSGSGAFSATGEGTSTTMTPQRTILGPNADNAEWTPYPTAEGVNENASRGTSVNASRTDSTGQSESWSTAESHSLVESDSTATTDGVSFGRSSMYATARTTGTAAQTGEAEAFEPVYADLPSSFHTLESERYRAGAILGALPVGRCVLNLNNRSIVLTVPPPKRSS